MEIQAVSSGRSTPFPSFDRVTVQQGGAPQASQAQEVDRQVADSALSQLNGLIALGRSRGVLRGQQLSEVESSLRQAEALVASGAVQAALSLVDQATGKASGAVFAEASDAEEPASGVIPTGSPTGPSERDDGEAVSDPLKALKTRAYHDVSSDAGVSFSAVAYMNAPHAELAVRGHEMEHVNIALAQALVEGRSIQSLTVSIRYGIDPYTGEGYTTGGETRITFSGRQGDKKGRLLDQTV